MSGEALLQTWEVLQALGFEPDPEIVYSDICPGLRFDFGNLKLSVSASLNSQFQKVVRFHGLIVTPRTIADIQFEMPRWIESREKCAAWLAWNLDNQTGGIFHPHRLAPWLELGRANLHQLPWYFDVEAYDARPHCTVDGEWARPLFKKLREAGELAPPDERAWFAFDGESLRISCGQQLVLTAANGRAWSERYGVQAEKLKDLPKRVMRPWVEVSIWKGKLSLSRNLYDGVISEPLASNPTDRPRAGDDR